MIKAKKVSIVVPVYNEITFLFDCVHSILDQTYSNIEIILVDDGSTNRAADDCDRLSAEDDRISVIHQSNQGVSSARVTGVQHAVGEWIMFVDNDDLIDSTIVEKLIDAIFCDDIDIVMARYCPFDDEGKISKCNSSGETSIIKYSGQEVCDLLSRKDCNITTPLWCKIYRKNFLDRLEIERYKSQCPIVFFEDVLMTPILFYYARQCILVDEVLYYHRQVSTSISHNAIKLGPFYYDQIYSGPILLDFLKEKKLDNLYYSKIPAVISLMVRIYCTDNANIAAEILQKNKNEALKIIRRYFHEYIVKSQDKALKKISITLFAISPNGFAYIWKLISK